jgi:hypothetical protein
MRKQGKIYEKQIQQVYIIIFATRILKSQFQQSS